MTKSDKILTALLTVVIGVLFIILKGGVISIAMTVLGAVLIVSAVIDLIHGHFVFAAVKAVIGILVIVFGWTLVSAVLYIFAALMLVYGVTQIAYMLKYKVTGFSAVDTLFKYADPVLAIVIAIFLLFNQGGTINWIFIVVGIALIVEGVIAFVNSFTKSKKTKNEAKKRNSIDI